MGQPETTIYYGSSERLPPPPGFTRRWLRDTYANPETRIPGSFRAPGRAGVMISADDFDAWLRSRRNDEPTLEEQVRARFECDR